MRSFCRKTSMSIKFLVLGGGSFGFGEGGKCWFYFYGREDFSEFVSAGKPAAPHARGATRGERNALRTYQHFSQRKTAWVDEACADCPGLLTPGAAGAAPPELHARASDCAPELASFFFTNPGTTPITILAVNSDHGLSFVGEETRTMVWVSFSLLIYITFEFWRFEFSVVWVLVWVSSFYGDGGGSRTINLWPFRPSSWICCPQLPYHPYKTGTHSTSFCSTRGHALNQSDTPTLNFRIWNKFEEPLLSAQKWFRIHSGTGASCILCWNYFPFRQIAATSPAITANLEITRTNI